MKLTDKKKRYVKPKTNNAILADDIMHWGSYYVDGEHGNTEYNDDDDAEGQDAKKVTFECEWDTWQNDNIEWF